MDWVLGSFKFRGRDFECFHFDVCGEERGARSGSDDDDDGNNGGGDELSAGEADGLEVASEEIGAVLWLEAAEACLEWLQGSRGSYASCRVLELGAGCGFVGLALAADGARVTVTDVARLLPLLERNARLANRKGGRVTAAVLDWGLPIPGDLKPDFALVVGCDLLYDSASPEALSAVVHHFVSGDTEFRLSVNLRDQGGGLARLLELLEPRFICSVRNVPGVALLLARRR
eukprot:jgi/Tetstr1/423657/TSEL_014292.t1